MRIKLSNAGKRFNRDWIFRRADLVFEKGNTYAITGTNGSGKSTLLQVLSGSMEVSEGTIAWEVDNKEVGAESVFSYLTLTAPYIEVIEEMTAIEFLQFHSKFKSYTSGISVNDIIEAIGLQKSASKQIRYYSSGMKQRIKLAQSIFSDTPLLLLDEPCTNLDSNGFDLYHSLINKYAGNKTIVVSSNDVNEYSFCKNVISIMDYK